MAQCAGLPVTPHANAAAGPFAAVDTSDWPVQRTRSTAMLAAAITFVLSVPLFVGLDRQDIRNDEAIYTYASQRIVETGDWLTPRYVATDGLFVEKPPLKFWIVAGALHMGWVPNSVAGVRLVDALLSAVAFAYVMALGWRVAGVACGAVALVLLLSFHPLLFDHGLRENNMESALFLSYAAGLFHFFRWAEGGAARRAHALRCTLWFVLGFMTKFVAALFLPMVGVAALLVTPGGWRYLWGHWRDWLIPASVAVALVVPWFIYQTVVRPEEFWETIFGAHVYMRFTEFVDPAHLRPWHFYLTDVWSRLESDAPSYRRLHNGDAARIAVIGGFIYTLWRARGPARGTAALLLLWWALPFALISMGTSKVTHYAYPFLPPLALAAGWLFADGLRAADRDLVPWLRTRIGNLRRPRLARPSPYRRLVIILVFAALAVAIGTYFNGPLTWMWGETRIVRNSSVIRPIAFAALLLIILDHVRVAVRITSVTALVLLLPLDTAGRTVTRAMVVDRPLKATSDCLRQLDESDPGLHRGFYLSDPGVPELAVHQLYYSFRNAGPWVQGMDRFAEEVGPRLLKPDRQSPLLMSPEQWRAAGATASRGEADVPAALQVAPGVILVLPGPYRACAPEIRAAGGLDVEVSPAR